MKKIVEIYKQVFAVLQKNPTILFLFLFLGILDAIALTILFFAPIPPVSNILAPIIRAFWSDKYLHYPYNFLLLPKLYGHAHFLISTVLGVFISGIIIKQIEAGQSGERVPASRLVKDIFKKYISLVIGWLFSYAVFMFALRLLPLLPMNLPLQIGANFILSLIVQALVAFLIPALVLLDRNFFYTLWHGLKVGFQNIGLMCGVFFLPMLLVLGLSIGKFWTVQFVKIYPEAVLWVLAIGVVITMIMDLFITSSATLLFLETRNKK